MKRTAKGGRKKQSISASDRQREKEGPGQAETAAGASHFPGSQSSHEKRAISLADECDFRNVDDPSEIEACCLYEYFRESAVMCEAFQQRRPMPLQGYRDADIHDYVRLRVALTTAGFPVPWNRLSPEQRVMLARPLYSPDGEQYFGTGVLDWALKDTDKHPPLLVKKFLPAHDPLEAEALLEQWKQAAYYDAPLDRSYFFGLFRLDEGYNETEAKDAFTAWFKERFPQTKSGNRERWQAKLNDLVVMRLRKLYPGKKNLIKRVQHVAELTTLGFAGCKAFWNDRQKAKREKREVEQRMSKAANEEMSRARADARKFFQTVFPGETPLHY